MDANVTVLETDVPGRNLVVAAAGDHLVALGTTDDGVLAWFGQGPDSWAGGGLPSDAATDLVPLDAAGSTAGRRYRGRPARPAVI